MNFLRKVGGKTLGLILALLFISIATTISFIMKVASLPVFILLLLCSVTFIVLVLIDRKKSLIKEQKELMEKAEECIRKREWKNAHGYFDRALFLDSANYKAMMGKGYCYRAKMEYKLAISQFKKVIKIKNDHPDAFFLLGVCYLEERFLKEAMTSFQKVISLAPEHRETYLFIGDIHRFQGEREFARKYYLKYLEGCDNENIRNVILEKLESVKEIDDVEDNY